jgi:hypothetical protein
VTPYVPQYGGGLRERRSKRPPTQHTVVASWCVRAPHEPSELWGPRAKGFTGGGATERSEGAGGVKGHVRAANRAKRGSGGGEGACTSELRGPPT